MLGEVHEAMTNVDEGDEHQMERRLYWRRRLEKVHCDAKRKHKATLPELAMHWRISRSSWDRSGGPYTGESRVVKKTVFFISCFFREKNMFFSCFFRFFRFFSLHPIFSFLKTLLIITVNLWCYLRLKPSFFIRGSRGIIEIRTNFIEHWPR